jgi:hypothetical protein
MLTEIYIEALLDDENLADQVWALRDAGVITDEVAAWVGGSNPLTPTNISRCIPAK